MLLKQCTGVATVTTQTCLNRLKKGLPPFSHRGWPEQKVEVSKDKRFRIRTKTKVPQASGTSRRCGRDVSSSCREDTIIDGLGAVASSGSGVCVEEAKASSSGSVRPMVGLTINAEKHVHEQGATASSSGSSRPMAEPAISAEYEAELAVSLLGGEEYEQNRTWEESYFDF